MKNSTVNGTGHILERDSRFERGSLYRIEIEVE